MAVATGQEAAGSRKRHREFSEKDAVVIKKDKDCTVKAYKKINDQTGEVELYCHSTLREDKERAIYDRFTARFEEALDKLNAGLHKKGCIKKYDKVLVSLGRLKQKYSRAAKNYRITVNKDKKTGNAVRIIRKSTHPEPRQQVIYDALGLSHYPGRIIKKTVSA